MSNTEKVVSDWREQEMKRRRGELVKRAANSLVVPAYQLIRFENMWVTKEVKVPGGFYYPNFLTQKEQDVLIDIIDNNAFQHVVHRRQQFYGQTYYHTSHDLKAIQPENEQEGVKNLSMAELDFLVDKLTAIGFQPRPGQEEMEITRKGETALVNEEGDLIASKDQIDELKTYDFESPTQCLVNEYIGNMGIGPHFDDFDAFGPYIATVSLTGPVLMTLSKPEIPVNKCKDIIEDVSVLLETGSLFIMAGDCRFKWLHEIKKRPKTVKLPATGDLVLRDNTYRRVSLTLRTLLSGRKQVAQNGDFSGIQKLNVFNG